MSFFHNIRLAYKIGFGVIFVALASILIVVFSMTRSFEGMIEQSENRELKSRKKKEGK